MNRTADAAVGMMDNAYFVGRGELLDFFNELLDLRLTKIEQTASGAVACQLTEYIFPGSIPMSRVNWEAKSDYEFIGNYKLLQAAFSKNRVQRHVDVDKLIRAKYQDNLEFCQWLKAFFDQSGAVREEYDPVAVRGRGKGGNKYNDLLEKTAKKHGSKALPASRKPTTPVKNAAPRTSATQRKSATGPTSANTLRSSNNKNTTPESNSSAVADAALQKKNTELTARVSELETTVVELEKERDFYFSKLRDVEFMLQIQQDKGMIDGNAAGVVEKIFKVLYATAEENITVSEDGEILEGGAPVVSDDLGLGDDDLGLEGDDENLLTDELM